MKLKDHRDASFTTHENWTRILQNDPSLTWLEVHLMGDDSNINDTIINFMNRVSQNVTTSTNFNDVDIARLGNDIGENTAIKSLQFCGPLPDSSENIIHKANREFHTLCGGGVLRNQSITHLNISCMGGLLNGEVLSHLSYFIAYNPNISIIENVAGKMTRDYVQLLAISLLKRRSPLEGLILSENGIDDMTIQEFITSFLEYPQLAPQKLYLRGNEIGKSGYSAIAQLLQTNKCQLKVLCLSEVDNFDNDMAILLANALRNNKSLKILALNPRFVTKIGWDAITSAVSDPNDRNATYSSNHTLEHVRSLVGNNSRWIPSDLQVHLELNRDEDKSAVARWKVFQRHFMEGVNVKQFAGMDKFLLIRVLSYFMKIMADEKAESRRGVFHIICWSAIFQLIQNNPQLCSAKKDD